MRSSCSLYSRVYGVGGRQLTEIAHEEDGDDLVGWDFLEKL